MRYRFGCYEVSLPQRQLIIDDQLQDIGGRAFDLLVALIERRERVVSARELFRLVWPEASVQPNNLRVQVWALRRLLGPSTIVTVARRGYHFTAEVEVLDAGAAPPAPLVLAVPAGRSPGPAGSPAPARWSLDVDDVCDALESCRLVTLVGAGDLGRRHVALAVSRRFSRAPGGVWRLEAHRRAADAVDSMLRRLTRQECLLILLDAHLAGEGLRDTLTTLLASSPWLRILATSEGALGVAAERLMWISPWAAQPSLTEADPRGAGRVGLRWRVRGTP